MFAIAVLHPAAKSDEILVGINHGPLARTRRPGVVGAFIQGDPTAAKLFSPTYLWPRHSTAHAVFLEFRLDPREPNGAR